MEFHFTKTHPDAVAPTKSYPTDSGWDVTVLSLDKELDDGNVHLYNSHLTVKPPPGYYFEIVPRSSISKTGYSLANSVGVIDSSYTGNLYVALRKSRPDVKPLELPCRIAQLILRPLIHATAVQVESLDITDRGSGGFGSTNQT